MLFVKTGGFNGYIEYFDRMVARILPFRRRIIPSKNSFDDANDFKKLAEFNTASFLDKVKSVCTSKATTSLINEMYQLDLLLMLPGICNFYFKTSFYFLYENLKYSKSNKIGQELPMHLNVPYFMGANRNTLPQWLLVDMKHSKLFDHLYVHQVS